MSPKRARKRPTVCGASAISGTSTITPRPRSSVAAAAWRYTSVLPLPVGPASRTWPPPRVERGDDPRDRAALVGGQLAGSGSPPSDSRSTGDGRSARRFGIDGATSSSARAGVEP